MPRRRVENSKAGRDFLRSAQANFLGIRESDFERQMREFMEAAGQNFSGAPQDENIRLPHRLRSPIRPFDPLPRL